MGLGFGRFFCNDNRFKRTLLQVSSMLRFLVENINTVIKENEVKKLIENREIKEEIHSPPSSLTAQGYAKVETLTALLSVAWLI